MKKIEVYSAGDYAGMEVGDLYFYYGYEVTEPEDDDDWEGDSEWCFQVKKGVKEIFRMTTSQIEKAIPDFDHDEPVNILLAGIAIWLEKQNINL